MKKLLSVLLAVLMLCSVACAEETAFTFRNGLHWGMSPDEVLVAEGRTEFNYSDELSYTVTEYDLDGLTVSKFESDIRYLFVNGQLASLLIDPDLWIDDSEDIDYLKQALSLVYGAPDENLPVPQTVNDLLTISEFHLMCGWLPAEDVYICIIFDDNFIELCYFNPNIDFVAEMQSVAPTPTPEPIITTGL